MSQGYIRQSAGLIVTGNTIEASHFNNEFNELEEAFDATIGHTHDGTVGGGGLLTPASLDGLSSDGIVVRTSATTFASRSLAAPAAGFTITNPAGIAGNPTFVLANDLAALEGLASTGIAVRTASDTWAQRTITAGANLVVTNGNGVSGNPTVALDTTLNLTGSTITGGAFTPASLTVNDSVFTLRNTADITKLALFDLSGITTGTSRTYTLPNVTGALVSLGNITQAFTGTTQFTGTFTAAGATSTLGSNNGAITVNVGTGATTSGNTKSINIGTGGLSGSTTTMLVGTTASGATDSLTVYSPTTLQNGAAAGSYRIGADVNAKTLTALTRKIGRIVAPNYTDAGNTPNVFMIGVDANNSTRSYLDLGGTSGGAPYAVTDVRVYTASDISTTGGTLRLSVSGANGDVNVATGDLTVTNAGTAATSVATLNGTQILRNKTIADNTHVCEGRLTLTSGTPVTTTDVTGATTIYFTPFRGNQAAIYTGTYWYLHTFTELSLALGTLTSGRPYDVFLDYNAGTPILASVAWTNDSTRATTLALQDGVLVQSGTPTRRYLGTFYTTSTTTTEDSAAKRYLWNYYNAVRRPMKFLELTASWNYSTATWRQMRATAANKFEFVIGVAGDVVFAQIPNFMVFNSTATYRSSGVAWGLDSTSVPSGDAIYHEGRGNSTAPAQVSAIYRGIPAEGRHTLVALEKGDGTDTQTWSANNSGGVWQANFGANGEINA